MGLLCLVNELFIRKRAAVDRSPRSTLYSLPPPPIQVNLVTKELFRVAPNPLLLSKMAHEDLQQIIRCAQLCTCRRQRVEQPGCGVVMHQSDAATALEDGRLFCVKKQISG